MTIKRKIRRISLRKGRDRMSFRGEQHNKKNGTTYIYEATSVWNAEKGRSEQRRVYIGKKDPATGAFVPNDTYFRLHGESEGAKTAAGGKPVAVDASYDFGPVALMRHASDVTGLTGVLRSCFPKDWEEILACEMHC